MSVPFVRKSVKILSPLRYPGAKRRLGAYITEVLRLNDLKPKLFVEPFAGSLSISLQLLDSGTVEKIAVGEKDPLVASFWKVAFNDTEWLKQQIRKIPVTLKKWQYFKDNKFRTNRERALACLFLNRTSFSGILCESAGPIGGKAQESAYAIDCRFNVDTLVKRLDKVAALKHKVLFIENGDWTTTIDRVKKLGFEKNQVFYYFDPPFYEKAEKLYRYFFDDDGHQKLHDKIMKINNPWLLSYDAAPSIIEKYTNNGSSPQRVGFLYSTAAGTVRPEVDELIITNLESLPNETRLWRKTAEWKKIG